MKLYGLIGFPLDHSFSKGYFTNKFKEENIRNSKYVNFPIDNINKIPDIIINNRCLLGLNVTIPYKEQVIKYLDELDPAVEEIGAVNTIKITRTGTSINLKGYNTDVYGFENSVAPLIIKDIHKKALILGTGGASKAIKYIFKKLNIEFISASIEELKENEIRYEEIDEKMMKQRLIVVHCTPLGTYPDINTFPPIPYNFITPDHILFDLVYNPSETVFLRRGKEKGAKIKNGLEMLHLQAEKAYEIWNS
ncbi:MAG: shikimate dehydrogenase [Bacteroidales bacterium]|nr:shikimate dehydrogenase [Bacteroidales bacterium]